MGSSDTQRREVYEHLLFVRRFEERVLDAYESGGVPELPHLSIGQEAVGVGATYALADDDWIAPSLRTRAPILMRVPLETVTAGMFGTRSGPSSGRTTQHHMGSTEHAILGTTGMVGSHLNAAVGAGLSSRQLGIDRVSMVFFGDGATTRGEFHTALNYAAVEDLPVVFVIENNLWTEETPISEVAAVDDLVDFAGHDLPSVIVDGQDADEVVDVATEAVDRARRGDGPTLIEAKTYRYRPHAEVIQERRPKEELEKWKRRDPVDIYRERLLDHGIADEEWLEEIDESIREEIDEAFAFAAEDPLPDEEAMYHVYKDVEVDRNGGVVR
ncbi:thiamine pyrophosphate-dependent dehydrogenase E1 component subunit alpha [Halopenitus salinus]|jgi:TPP-dependent pyruvate/acetoin dehydrogenase alpha subunit|uniref:Thiamine pyrophosphate-dependent dehydrogenase E1 component subunit alpha n=1 Tax=Halopenitus salinus TaxID=1198295 RepID=A0ABD5UUY3_9EURY